MKKPNEIIWEKFHIHAKDSLPFSPWLENANRTHLAELFFELGYTKGAEIGVRTGGFSKVMLECNPKLTLLLIDPWTPYMMVKQDQQDKYLRHCEEKMAPFGDRAVIMKMTSEEALKQVANDSLDFVYVDGIHDFDNTMFDLICWNKKVRKGGMMAGHDYYNFFQSGVIPAVNAFASAHRIEQWYTTKELEPSWFWVK